MVKSGVVTSSIGPPSFSLQASLTDTGAGSHDWSELKIECTSFLCRFVSIGGRKGHFYKLVGFLLLLPETLTETKSASHLCAVAPLGSLGT